MFKLPCEKCKKKIDIRATVCPFCQTQFSADEVKSRKKGAAMGCLLLVLVIGGCTWWIGKDENSASPPIENQMDISALAFEATGAQQTAIDFSRSIWMQTLSCEGTVDQVQGQLDKLAEGRTSLVDAYSSARSGAGSCESDLKLLKETDLSPLKDAKAIEIAKQALASCVAATEKRVGSLRKLQTFLNGNGDLDASADYKAGIHSAMNDAASCKLTIAGLPAHFQVPESEADFLN
ncbi:MAG: hypothetical protein AB7E05_09255 [Sphingobium sp.]